MSERPIAYVMEQTLGNITHYLNLRGVGPIPEGGPRRWVPVEYREGRGPWTIRGGRIARRELSNLHDEVDGVFIHTSVLSVMSVDLVGRRPTVLSTDGTPANKRHMREAYGLGRESRVAAAAKRSLYRTLFSRASGLVAWSHWTGQSFVRDYGSREEDVAVIPPGIDRERFTPGDRDHEVPRILFVGGDFARKGGDLLLDVYRQRLRDKAELVIVTRDDIANEPGVTVHRDVKPNSDELVALYGSCDMFVLPTRADCFSLVGMEALAAGLPLVVTKVGGLPEMVQEGITGHVVDVDHAGQIGDALESLATQPAQRRAMSEACRQVAAEQFDVLTNARRLFEFVRSRC